MALTCDYRKIIPERGNLSEMSIVTLVLFISNDIFQALK
jgi:hypothetical protein